MIEQSNKVWMLRILERKLTFSGFILSYFSYRYILVVLQAFATFVSYNLIFSRSPTSC